MSLEPEQIEKWVAEHGPWLHHACSAGEAERILAGDAGIEPSDDPRTGRQRPFLSPRRDCAYLGTREYLDADCPLRVDIRRLDPAALLVDEDQVVLHPDRWDPAIWRPDAPVPFPAPPNTEMTLGEWVDALDFDTPEHVLTSLRLGSIAVRRGIPREAIAPAEPR
jgi:hypothetical protein